MRMLNDSMQPERTLVVSRRTILCALGLGLAGCSSIPGSGPRREEVMSPQAQAAGQFAVVEIDPNTLSILTSRPSVSFRGQFGDYRPSPDQVIGIGDSISVTIWEAASGGLFSAPVVDRMGPGSRTAVIPEQVVSRDGSVTVPYAGRVRVQGLRPAQVENRIIESLRGRAIEPQVLVTITRNASNTVTVSGEVVNGAIVPVNVRGQKLLDVIAVAGGARAPVHETFITLIRGNRSISVPMPVVLERPSENIYVRAGDVITLIRAPLSFTAIGATGQNAVVPFGQIRLSLEEAIGRAGGLSDFRADPEGIFVLRFEPVDLVRKLVAPRPLDLPGPMVPVAYRLNMRDPAAMFAARAFVIQDKDIVYVANAPMTEVQKVFSLINTLTSPVIQGVAVGSAVR